MTLLSSRLSYDTTDRAGAPWQGTTRSELGGFGKERIA